MDLNRADVMDMIERWLAEDVAGGDVTTSSLFGDDHQGACRLTAKEPGILAGLEIAGMVFHHLDPAIQWDMAFRDGDAVKAGDRIGAVTGRTRSILTGERLALNLLQRMSGIATAARAYVDAVRGCDVTVLDTRKTAPGMRMLDKYAVRTGGAVNHRMTLHDLAMIKDNHIRLAGGITPAVAAIRKTQPDIRIEVETEDLDGVREALAAGADIIMLDNMSLDMMREAVRIIGQRARTEASGNVTLDRIRAIAETGVNAISIGALTHSVRALDISMKADEPETD